MVSIRKISVALLVVISMLAVPTGFGRAGSGLSISTVGQMPDGSAPTALRPGPQNSFWLALQNPKALARFTPPDVPVTIAMPSAGVRPFDLVVGSDQNLWFTEPEGNALGVLDGSGVVKETALSQPSSYPTQITLGQDGGLWFTEFEGGRIGRYLLGEVKEYALPKTNSQPFSITTAVDGSLWFSEWNGGKVGSISPKNGEIHEYSLPTQTARPAKITVDPEGYLWLIYNTSAKVVRIDPADGSMNEYSLNTQNTSLADITAGVDGNMWYIGPQAVGRFSPGANGPENVLETALPEPVFSGSGRSQISPTPDGRMWFITANSALVREVTPATFGQQDVQVFFNEFPAFLLSSADFTLRAEVVNNSAVDVHQLNLELALDDGMTYLGATGAACTASGLLVTCTADSLPASGHLELSFNLHIEPVVKDALPRQVSFSAHALEPDFQPANNRTYRDITVQRAFSYFNDFSAGAGQNWSQQQVTTGAAGLTTLGPFANDNVRLSFDNLPPHDQAMVCYDLYVLGAWDGNQTVQDSTPEVIGPDLWSNYMDESPLLVTTFSNQAQFSQAYPAGYRRGENPAQTAVAEVGRFGGPDGSSDARYHICFWQKHSGKQLLFTFYGVNLDKDDGETWALDNVSVRVSNYAADNHFYVPQVLK